MKTRGPLVLALATTFLTSPLSAQTASDDATWSLDFQAGAAVPTSEIEGEDVGTGFGFEANVAYRIATHVSVYGGWDWHRFAPDAVLGEPDVDLEETGYVVGLRFDHPFGAETGHGPSYRLRAGVTLNHIELEDSDGELIDDSGHGAGFEVGAGLFMPLTDTWRIGPEVRFRALSRELDIGSGDVDVDLRYLAFDIVFSRSF